MDGFTVGGFVASGEVFETPKIVAAIENLEGGGINFANRDVEMRPPAFDMTDDETRAIPTYTEFDIDRLEETRQLRG